MFSMCKLYLLKGTVKYEFRSEEHEAFFERYFDLEKKDVENKVIAEQIFEKSAAKVEEMIEQLMIGEAIDEPTMVLELSNMILAHQYQQKFTVVTKE